MVLGVSCSQIIGISDYEIDPSLEPASPGEGGSGNEAGGASSQGASAGQVGEGEGGDTAAGRGGQAGEPAQAGGAGGAPTGCRPEDCDDTIDCTIDSCDDNGECQHTPDSSLCDADAGECVACQVGLGCVPTEPTTIELLVDPWFDELSNAWTQDVRYTQLQTEIITLDDYAESGDYSAWYLGVEDDGTEQAYMDLYQPVTIPPNTRSLRLRGVYELFNGTVAPEDDYAVAGLFEGVDELHEFQLWSGDDPETASWTDFEYVVDQAELSESDLLGAEVSFSIYGYSWDTAFYFDTLSLEASVCE